MLSTRSTRNNVTPAPSAPGIACTANVDTSASNSGNPRLPATKPAKSSIPARKSAASAVACCALSDRNGKPSASSMNSVIPALNSLGGAGNRHRSPAPPPVAQASQDGCQADSTPDSGGAETQCRACSLLRRQQDESTLQPDHLSGDRMV